jgi:hypothetical protein
LTTFDQKRTFKFKVSVTNYELVLPSDFQDYAYEVESKGWYSGARLRCMGRQFSLTFYDPTRLRQEIEDELRRSPAFTAEPNLLVVASVTEASMRNAVEHAVAAGLVEMFVSE